MSAPVIITITLQVAILIIQLAAAKINRRYTQRALASSLMRIEALERRLSPYEN